MKIFRMLIGIPFGIALLIVAIGATFLLGCASVPTQPARPPMALLVIENDRADAEWIYLERDGARGRHIATVPALTTDTLALRDSDVVPGATFDLIAIAFGATLRAPIARTTSPQNRASCIAGSWRQRAARTSSRTGAPNEQLHNPLR